MIFLRHPKPGNASGLCYGRTDLDIGPDGEAEIARAMEATPKVGLVIASPALRCRRLASVLAARYLAASGLLIGAGRFLLADGKLSNDEALEIRWPNGHSLTIELDR